MDTRTGEGALDSALGKIIAMQRRRLDISQVELAVRSGLARSTIERVERGGRSPSIAQLAAIAAALEVTASALVAEAERGPEAGALPPGVAREVERLEREAHRS